MPDMTRPYNREIALLAERSDGSRDDIINEWAYRPHEYPTLCAKVRRGITSIEAIVIEARIVHENAEITAWEIARDPGRQLTW